MISEFTVGKNDQRKGSPVIMQFAVGKKWPEKRISDNHAVYCWKNGQRKGCPVIMQFTVGNMAREKDLR